MTQERFDMPVSVGEDSAAGDVLKKGRTMNQRMQTVLIAITAVSVTATGLLRAAEAPEQEHKKVAALVADWFKGSHPDVIIGRIVRTWSNDGKGEPSKLTLASVYRDLPSERDVSTALATEHNFRICNSIEEALTLGTGKLAVDGVIISTEWASYPVSATGQIMYPHRKMFGEIVKVFKASGRVVPVFIDKHIDDNWEDIKWISDTATEMKIPLMAGSSVPVAWHRPPVNVERNAKLKEIVGISYHTLDGYGFHGMEMVQCLAERREGGETGIKSVQCFTNEAVWQASGKAYDPELLKAALDRLSARVPEGKQLKDVVPNPVLFTMEYADGLRVNLFTLNGLANQWTAAWRYANGKMDSTLFWLQEDGSFMHFAWQLKGIEEMMLTGRPAWPAERTILTSGALDALLISKKEAGRVVETPYLGIRYKCDWEWKQPPEP